MKVIIISGPSGSGKTTLATQIYEKIKNVFVLSTDNYYKTGTLSKLLSIFIKNYFDRKISMNYNLLKKDLNYILTNKKSKYSYSYDFYKKTIKRTLKETNDINYLIIEGIFAKNILCNFVQDNFFFIELKIDKKSCMDRVIKRDVKERGKIKEIAKCDFLYSWKLYYDKNRISETKADEVIYSKKTNIELLIKKIISLKT